MLAQIIAQAQADICAPISSITIIAPVGGDAGLLTMSVASGQTKNCAVDSHQGVSAALWSRMPDHAEAIAIDHLIEQQVIAAAWSAGAWDIQRVTYAAGYEGPLPPSLSGTALDMRRFGWTSWTYRPMMGGPELRQKAHGHKDSTLIPILLGRSGQPPDICTPEVRPGRMTVIRLGAPPEAPKAPRRASGKQRAYIVALRKGTDEEGAKLPARLTMTEATGIINHLIKSRDNTQ